MRLLKIISIVTTFQIMVVSGCGGGSGGGGTAPDTTPPTVTAFTMPATATSTTVSVTSFTATDNVGVTGYLITESATPPAANAAGWTASAPASFTFSAAGVKTAYAWAKDAAGNISSSQSATVTITQQSIMTVSVGGMPANAYTIQVNLDFTNATGYSFNGYLDANNYVISSDISTPTATASQPTDDGFYNSTDNQLTLGVVESPTSSAISNGIIINMQFQAIPGFDATRIASTVTTITDNNGVSLATTGTTVSVTVQ